MKKKISVKIPGKKVTTICTCLTLFTLLIISIIIFSNETTHAFDNAGTVLHNLREVFTNKTILLNDISSDETNTRLSQLGYLTTFVLLSIVFFHVMFLLYMFFKFLKTPDEFVPEENRNSEDLVLDNDSVNILPERGGMVEDMMKSPVVSKSILPREDAFFNDKA